MPLSLETVDHNRRAFCVGVRDFVDATDDARLVKGVAVCNAGAPKRAELRRVGRNMRSTISARCSWWFAATRDVNAATQFAAGYIKM